MNFDSIVRHWNLFWILNTKTNIFLFRGHKTRLNLITLMNFSNSFRENKTMSINWFTIIKKSFSSSVCKFQKMCDCFFIQFVFNWTKIVVDQKQCFTAVVWYDLNTYSILIPYGQHKMPAVFGSLLNNNTKFDTIEHSLSEWCIPR